MSQVVESTKFSILEVITQLEDIWQEIGIKEDQKEIRSTTVLTHIQGKYKKLLHISVCIFKYFSYIMLMSKTNQ